MSSNFEKKQKMIPRRTGASFDRVFSLLKKQKIDVPLEIFHSNPFKALVSTVMSARTNDDITLIAANRLFKKAPTIKQLSKLSVEEIEKLIYPVGFYKIKAKNIKSLAKIVTSSYKGVIPQTREELVGLPGVGRKTANLVLNRAFNIPAIAVDTHVHRITNMLGWVKTNDPEKTELELMKVVPKKYWSEMNKLFVSLGRQRKTAKRVREFLQENQLISSQDK